MNQLPPHLFVRELIVSHLRQYYTGPPEMADMIADLLWRAIAITALKDASCSHHDEGADTTLNGAPETTPEPTPMERARAYVEERMDTRQPVDTREVARRTGWDAATVRRFVAALRDEASAAQPGGASNANQVREHADQYARKEESAPRRAWTLTPETRERMRERALERHARERAKRAGSTD